MDHQAIAQLLGNYGEFVGAIAVVLTLIYLALQIRQNSNTVAGATEMDLAREMTAWHARITADPELVALYEKGAINAPMTDEEVARYRWVIAELLWLYEGAYRQYQRGLLSENNWESVVVSAIGLLRGDALKVWWESRTSALSDEFVAYIDQRRAKDTGDGWHHRSVSD